MGASVHKGSSEWQIGQGLSVQERAPAAASTLPSGRCHILQPRPACNARDPSSRRRSRPPPHHSASTRPLTPTAYHLPPTHPLDAPAQPPFSTRRHPPTRPFTHLPRQRLHALLPPAQPLGRELRLEDGGQRAAVALQGVVTHHPRCVRGSRAGRGGAGRLGRAGWGRVFTSVLYSMDRARATYCRREGERRKGGDRHGKK